MIKSKEELCSQEDPKTITQQLRVQISSPLPMSLRLRTCPITASTMTTVPPGLPLIQNLLKNIQTQPHRSLQAAPDTLLALETMMLIQTIGANPNDHDADLLAADDSIIIALTNFAFYV